MLKFLHEELKGNGVMVSDFHYGSMQWRMSPERTRLAVQYLEEAAKKSDFLIFNGDMVELHQSTKPLDEAIRSGLDLVEMVASANKNCQLLYFMGNHDDVAYFESGLYGLGRKYGNITVVESVALLRNAIIYHGDRKERSPSIFWRSRFSPKKAQAARDKMEQKLEGGGEADFFVSSGPEKEHKRTKKSLELIEKGAILIDSVEHIFLAHSHESASNKPHDYKGKTYLVHNAGGLMEGAKCTPLEIIIEGGSVKRVDLDNSPLAQKIRTGQYEGIE